MLQFNEYTTGSVISADGTTIGYRQTGKGPALILVHGGVQSSHSFLELGKHLADAFTVYLPDRRGRGLSGGFGPNYSLQKDAQDMQALIRHTGAKNIFGLSSGAIVTLQTAINTPALKKVALYEPPILVNGVDHSKLNRDYENAIASGNLGRAMISIIKGTGDTSIFKKLPAFITAPFLNFGIKAQAKKATGDGVLLKDLVPTFHYDRIIVANAVDIIAQSKNLKAEVLLLGGTKSQKFLGMALGKLNAALPAARRITFPGFGHIAAANGNHPEAVATELKKFFTAMPVSSNDAIS
jgi:pimeloyl-ACP methyl ester carboxylesterase